MNRWVVKHYWWWKHWHSHTNLDDNDRTPSPPPIRSYQRDLIQYLVEAQANSLTDQSHQVEYYQETVEMKNMQDGFLTQRFQNIKIQIGIVLLQAG